jgi:hypothetical protein
MSDDPNKILAQLRTASEIGCTVTLGDYEAAWLIAQLKHKDDRIEALTKLVKPTPAPAAFVPTESICAEADRITSLDRQSTYGHPADDMSRTAAMWEAMLGLPPGAISPEKVAMCMIAVKLSRLCHAYKRDSVVDLAGYAKTISMICEG